MQWIANMAASTGAAAVCSLFWCYVFLFALQTMSMNRKISLTLNYGTARLFRQNFCWPTTSLRTSQDLWTVPGMYSVPSGCRDSRRKRRRKRGCWSGLQTRLRKVPHRTALPSIFLTNNRSITQKLDELELNIATNSYVRNSSVMIISETCLHQLIPDEAVQLAGHTSYRQDKNEYSSKKRGGGLCMYVNNNWCTNSRIIANHCSPDLEALSILCRPFYLPREISSETITAVYTLPPTPPRLSPAC